MKFIGGTDEALVSEDVVDLGKGRALLVHVVPGGSGPASTANIYLQWIKIDVVGNQVAHGDEAHNALVVSDLTDGLAVRGVMVEPGVVVLLVGSVRVAAIPVALVEDVLAVGDILALSTLHGPVGSAANYGAWESTLVSNLYPVAGGAVAVLGYRHWSPQFPGTPTTREGGMGFLACRLTVSESGVEKGEWKLSPYPSSTQSWVTNSPLAITGSWEGTFLRDRDIDTSSLWVFPAFDHGQDLYCYKYRFISGGLVNNETTRSYLAILLMYRDDISHEANKGILIGQGWVPDPDYTDPHFGSVPNVYVNSSAHVAVGNVDGLILTSTSLPWGMLDAYVNVHEDHIGILVATVSISGFPSATGGGAIFPEDGSVIAINPDADPPVTSCVSVAAGASFWGVTNPTTPVPGALDIGSGTKKMVNHIDISGGRITQHRLAILSTFSNVMQNVNTYSDGRSFLYRQEWQLPGWWGDSSNVGSELPAELADNQYQIAFSQLHGRRTGVGLGSIDVYGTLPS